MSKLFNIARMTSATAGTGTVTLGAAVSGYLTFALAGVANNQWVSYGIKDGANSEVGYGKYTSAGTTLTRNVQFSTNGNALINLSGTAEVYTTGIASDAPFPDNWLTGLTLSNDAGTPNTVFDIAIGAAADSTNTDIIRLTSAYTKSNGAWAVGTGNGGIDTAAVAASTWYHVHVIRRPDTGVVDVLFSLSATAPTLPTNYTQFRRIGSIKTDGGGNWIAFIQRGDSFRWGVPVNDLNAANPGVAAVTRTLTVPTGVIVEADVGHLVAAITSATIYSLISDLAVADTAPSGTAMSVGASNPGGVASLQVGATVRCMTNTSGQIRHRISASGASDTLIITTFGWRDTRGRDG